MRRPSKILEGLNFSNPAFRIAVGAAAIVVIGSGLVLLSGANPWTAAVGIVEGAVGERYMVAETIVSTIPLALIGLSLAPALRAGVFSIGSEGQVAIGAMTSTAAIMILPRDSAALLLIGGAVAGVLGGLVWAAIPATLRAYARVNEILSTLLLNYIAGFLLLWMLKTLLAAHRVVPLPQSDPLPDAALIPKMLEGTRLHWGFLFVPAFALALGWWLKSPRGMSYQIIATHVGLASRMGLTTTRAVMTTMLVSGAVAGLAGWLQVAGVAGTLYPTVAGGLGFTGVLVALLGRLGPLGILVAALFFGVLKTGADGLQAGTGVPSSIAAVIEGLVLFVAALSFAARLRPQVKAVMRPSENRFPAGPGLQELSP
jgi:general nucleoside transport system permease protein